MSNKIVSAIIFSLVFIASLVLYGQNGHTVLSANAETSQCSTRTLLNDQKRDNCEWSGGIYNSSFCTCKCPSGFYDYYETGSCAPLTTSTTSTTSTTTPTTSTSVSSSTTSTTTPTTSTTNTSSTITISPTTYSQCTMTSALEQKKYNCINSHPRGTWNYSTCVCTCPSGSSDYYGTGSCVYYPTAGTTPTTNNSTSTTTTTSTSESEGTTITGTTTPTTSSSTSTTTETTPSTNTTTVTTTNDTCHTNQTSYYNCLHGYLVGTWNYSTCTCTCPLGSEDRYNTGSCVKYTINQTNTSSTLSPTTTTTETNSSSSVTTNKCSITDREAEQKKYNCLNGFAPGIWDSSLCVCNCKEGYKDYYNTGSCVKYNTSIATETVCKISQPSWSECVNGQQKITECINGKEETRTRSCGVIQACDRDQWECGEWTSCINGKQKRECKRTFDCYIADNPPQTEKSCVMPDVIGTKSTDIKILKPETIEDPKIISSESGKSDQSTEQTVKTISNQIETIRSLETKPVEEVKKELPEECIKAGWNTASKCELYLQQSKIVSECLSKNINTKDGCHQYLLRTYGKPLRCSGLRDDQCNKLIDDVILSDLKEYVTEDVKQAISDAAGQTVEINTERRTITIDTVKDDKQAKVEVKIENIPLASKQIIQESQQAQPAVITATLIPMVEIKTSQQQIASPAAISFDDDGDGLPNDVEKRLGTDPFKRDTDGDGVDDKTEINNNKDPLSAEVKKIEVVLSGVDRALVDNKPLEQPKFNEIEKSTLLSVATVETPKTIEGEVNKSSMRLQGKAQPNTVVTLYIYSAMPIVVTVRTDENGNWVYDLDKTLVDGKHEVYVAINDDEGRIVAQSVPTLFFVQEAQAVSMEEYMNLEDATSVKNKQTEMMISYMFGGLGLILILIVGVLIIRGKTN